MSDAAARTDSATPARNSWLWLIAWAVLCVAVFGGRQAATDALWTDELFSLTTAEESPGRILQLLGRQLSGPVSCDLCST